MPMLELFLLPQGPLHLNLFPPTPPLLSAFHGYFRPHWSLHSELQWGFLCVSHYLVLQFVEQIFIFSVLGSELCCKGDAKIKKNKNKTKPHNTHFVSALYSIVSSKLSQWVRGEAWMPSFKTVLSLPLKSSIFKKFALKSKCRLV